MFTILVPVLASPITIALGIATRPSRVMRAELSAIRAQKAKPTPAATALSFSWQLDFIGLFLFGAGFGMFFVKITLANSQMARWSDRKSAYHRACTLSHLMRRAAHSIALLAVGSLSIIAFAAYERIYAPHPLLPFKLIRNKTVIGVLLLALIHPVSGRASSTGTFTPSCSSPASTRFCPPPTCLVSLASREPSPPSWRLF